jgi:hypothetical protein
MRSLWLGALCFVAGTAAAQPPAADAPASTTHPICRPTLSGSPRGADFSVCLDSWTPGPEELKSSVFADSYWERVRIERSEFQMRLGLHSVRGLAFESFVVHDETVPPPQARPGLVVAPRLSAPERFAGLRWERDNLLFDGDRVTLRAASEMQLLARAAGLLQSPEQAEALSLLGFRSRLQLDWQLGEAERRIHWHLTARVDRRREDASSSLTLRATRRF